MTDNTTDSGTGTVKLHQISVSDMDNNVYLLSAGGKGLLIDAAADAPAIFAMAEDAGVEITDVFTTHRHSDHVRALEEVLGSTQAAHWASFLDSPALPCKVDHQLKDGDVVEFAGHTIPSLILRGHTPGGAAIVVTIDGVPHAFVGDSLFPGGLGKTNGEGEFVRLFTEVKEKLFDVYPDETVILPGHGQPTTLGAERDSLDEWWQRRW